MFVFEIVPLHLIAIYNCIVAVNTAHALLFHGHVSDLKYEKVYMSATKKTSKKIYIFFQFQYIWKATDMKFNFQLTIPKRI